MEAFERFGPEPPRPRFASTLQQFELSVPPGKDIGRVSAVACAPSGDIYMFNPPNGGAYIPRDPAMRLPYIVHFDAAGRYLNGWGPESVPDVDGVSQWPDSAENVEVDAGGDVWVTGWNYNDHAVLRFSADGEFLRRYGQKGVTGDNDDTEWFNRPPSVYHDVENGELVVADGYGNNRVIAVDSETGAFTRMWGAYGKHPSDLSKEENFGIVHKIVRSPDGLIYVCDRPKNRVQEFELMPGGARFLREVVIGPGTLLMGSASDVVVTPDNKYLLVADMMAQRIWSVDRETFEVLGWASAAPETEGCDNIGMNLRPLHRIAGLPNGDLLLARGQKGVQKMSYLGVR
jgi:DNA-binding beta-propeller fold protein YncE